MSQSSTHNDSEGSTVHNSDHENKGDNDNNNERWSSAFITYPFVNAEPVNRQLASSWRHSNVDRENAETDDANPSFPQPYPPSSHEQPNSAYHMDTFRADTQSSGIGNSVTDLQYEKWPPPPVYGGIESGSGSGSGTETVRKPAIVGSTTKVRPSDPPD